MVGAAGVGLWEIIPQIALLVGLSSVCVYCSGAVHAAIAVHTALDVVAGSSMNSCSVHRVVVLHTLSEVADGVVL